MGGGALLLPGSTDPHYQASSSITDQMYGGLYQPG